MKTFWEKHRNIISIAVVILIFLFLPVFSVSTCSWNEGSMKAYNCSIDTLLFKSFGTFAANLLFISIFTMGIPLFLYLYLVVQLIKVIQEAHKKNRISYLFLMITISFLVQLCLSTYMNTAIDQLPDPVIFLIFVVEFIFCLCLLIPSCFLISRSFVLWFIWFKGKITHKLKKN